MRHKVPLRTNRVLGPDTVAGREKTTKVRREIRAVAERQQQNVVAQYLRAFGVTDLTLRTPPAYVNPDYTPEWQAFITANTKLVGNVQEKALRATLAFLMYCRELKLKVENPHFSYRDPRGRQKVDLNSIRRSVAEYEMRILATQLMLVFARNRLPAVFKLDKVKAELSRTNGADTLVVNYVLGTKSKTVALDSVLPLLEGSLYKGSLPEALKRTTTYGRDSAPTVNELMRRSPFSWYILYRDEFAVYMKRGRGGQLVVKVIIDLDYLDADNGDLPTREYLRAWNKTKKPM